MKVESGRGVTPASTTRRAAGAGAAGFAPALDGPAKAAAVAPAAAPQPLDAILALQAEGSPGERRARQVRRGRDTLDALQDLERALVLGAAPAGLLSRLERLRAGGEETGEAGLDAVLREIEVRLAVELAKLEMSARGG